MKVLIQIDHHKDAIVWYSKEPHLEVNLQALPNIGDNIWLSDKQGEYFEKALKDNKDYEGVYPGDCSKVCDRIFDITNDEPIYRIIVSNWRSDPKDFGKE